MFERTTSNAEFCVRKNYFQCGILCSKDVVVKVPLDCDRSARFEIICDMLVEFGQTTMGRMRDTRKYTVALTAEAVARHVASQKWAKERADARQATDANLLDFKEAALKDN